MRRVLIVACLTLACGGRGFDTTAPTNARELWVEATILSQCATLGVLHVDVNFTNHRYLVPCGQGQCTAAMWVYPGEVVVWYGTLEYDDARIEAWARHECCHVFDYQLGIPPTEARANQCAADRFGSAPMQCGEVN